MPKKKKDFKQIILEYLLKRKDSYISKSEVLGEIHKYRQGNMREASIAIDYLYEIGAIRVSNFRYRGIEQTHSTFDCKITEHGTKYLEKLKAPPIAAKPDKRFTEIRVYHVPPDLLKSTLKQGLSVDDLIKSYND